MLPQPLVDLAGTVLFLAFFEKKRLQFLLAEVTDIRFCGRNHGAKIHLRIRIHTNLRIRVLYLRILPLRTLRALREIVSQSSQSTQSQE